ncbi:MATE family efflux transporter [Lacrimispora saccharolytica]|uniref:Probable multidrug resistance protein NorM n=1 Tax=Lacrimispora saccharolytica (strain ATCC 35040 / DSM 2544 / NRCC 2533 / WM1) TaxID=610130 RepID=D9R881_LACSW|nr:MATE family efflux transporter [Lacrimispora saccharolytica]ADL03833.1 MATE efflux family protein [[Clostridium] saccharolyticum WM1]QRV21851.1 MATE family efflux transporter [Lacrimispora saccharolytica]
MNAAKDLINGNETKAMINFAIPMIAGNLFQQLYNVADTVIVGKFIGSHALAAVGSSFSVMVLLTSIIIGFCMGSSVVFSMYFGSGEIDELKNCFFTAFVFIGIITVVINVCSIFFIDKILTFINIPQEVFADARTYLKIIFYGLGLSYIYNYFSAAMRSMGNSVVPLAFLILSAVINIGLDILFVVPLQMGIAGAAYATIIAQGFSAAGIALYAIVRVPPFRLKREHFYLNKSTGKKIANFSILSSIQYSVMNFGILMIQSLVNSFGVSAMAAFAAVVKIESFAYMPVQDFGNAFSTFIAQNTGAGKKSRIYTGIRSAVKIITVYCALISIFIFMTAKPLMVIFISHNETEILGIGVQYLSIVAGFYCLIGYLFMFYGLFRGIGKPGISIILTVVSLGVRVLLAYTLSSVNRIGIVGIWWAIPIGWALADVIGVIVIRHYYVNDVLSR